jgi:hypothetical protein
VGGSAVDVEVRVGAGVIGENIRGFCVAVGCAAGAAARAGNVCVGRLTGALTGALSRAGTEVASSVHEAIRIQITNVGTNKRFIKAKYIGRKLSSDEFFMLH